MSSLYRRVLKHVTPRYCYFDESWIMEFGPVLAAGDTVQETKNHFRNFFESWMGEYTKDNLGSNKSFEEAFDEIGKNIRPYKGICR